MFADKLSSFLNRVFKPQTKYITVGVAGDSSAEKQLPPDAMPKHVAIIMDGNGRWANRRGLPRSAGHAAGVERVRDVTRASDEWGVKALTLYAFSTENWSRSSEEVGYLMGLLLKYLKSEIDELDEKHVRVQFLGDLSALPDPQREAVFGAMERTKNNTGLKLNIALNYGGRAELVRAMRLLAEKVAAGELKPEEIDEAAITARLYTADLPDVDLLIRTSGEMRLSNFLPWQSTYAEMVFDPTLWPDYDRACYLANLRQYASRSRRFGGAEDAVKAPVTEDKK